MFPLATDGRQRHMQECVRGCLCASVFKRVEVRLCIGACPSSVMCVKGREEGKQRKAVWLCVCVMRAMLKRRREWGRRGVCVGRERQTTAFDHRSAAQTSVLCCVFKIKHSNMSGLQQKTAVEELRGTMNSRVELSKVHWQAFRFLTTWNWSTKTEKHGAQTRMKQPCKNEITLNYSNES